MKKTDIMSNISKTFHKIGFSAKKHSPEILMIAGITGTVVSAVMACKATTKAGEIIDKSKEDIDSIHKCLEDKDLKEEYTEEDSKKDLTIVYIQTGVKFAKLYAPSVMLGALSITSILASNNILKKRNVALGAAYASVDKGFKEYRKRVVDKFGDSVDKELKYGIKAKKVEETVVDEETGKEKKVKKEIETVNDDGLSMYARFFDSGSYHWEKDSEYNLMFLRAQQNYANDLLRSRGYLFLNEVYDMLDIPKSKAGQVVGWRYDPDNPNIDSFVDFGIYEINREANRDFINGYEPVILLDFNVDGNIWDSMPEQQCV